MSNITALPLCSLRSGVQADEDLLLGIAFTNTADGTPADISGIAFVATLSLAGTAVATMAGQIYGVSDRVAFIALAANKAFLAPTTYALSILASDGVLKKDLLGASTLTVGAAQAPVLIPYNSTESLMTATVIPPGLVVTTASDVATALVALSRNERVALANALLQSLPNVAKSESIPASGDGFVNADSYVVMEP